MKPSRVAAILTPLLIAASGGDACATPVQGVDGSTLKSGISGAYIERTSSSPVSGRSIPVSVKDYAKARQLAMKGGGAVRAPVGGFPTGELPPPPTALVEKRHSVPEPSSLWLLLSGCAAFALAIFTKRKKG